MSRIELSGLGKDYGAGRGLAGLDLDIAEGEFFVLLGPSGCGKTTALRCVAGLEEPDRGRVSIGGRTVTDTERGVFVGPDKRGLGMVFQSYALWPHLTVAANVSYPLRTRGWNRRRARDAVTAALSRVDMLAYLDRYPAELSGGQQQRVALARALVASPELLLFDEPLSNLDAQLRTKLRADLRELHREQRHTALYVTHDQAEALSLADRLAVLRAGKVEQIGTPEQIFLQPTNRFVAEFVGFDDFLPAAVEEWHDGIARVQYAGAFLLARCPAPVRAAQPVTLAIRSNHVQLEDGTGGISENLLPVTLRDAAYLGEYFQCTVAAADGTSLTAQVPADYWHIHGSRLSSQPLYARLPRQALTALPAQP